ncbi:MAG: hypothetical protein HFH74_07085 [Lachnospiraceae bacterium]|jgi:hypothetical protein|nr:hypothetical protein [Lachnospiraceae bacterium]
MRKILGTIFLVFGFLEVILLSFASTFDRVEYTDKNHFVGFMSFYDLWIFFVGALVAICLGVLLLILEEKK